MESKGQSSPSDNRTTRNNDPEKWLQYIRRTTSEISVRKSALLETAEMCRSLDLPPSGKAAEPEDILTTRRGGDF